MRPSTFDDWRRLYWSTLQDLGGCLESSVFAYLFKPIEKDMPEFLRKWRHERRRTHITNTSRDAWTLAHRAARIRRRLDAEIDANTSEVKSAFCRAMMSEIERRRD